MHKKLNGKTVVGKPIVIPEDIAAAFGVVPKRKSKMAWTSEQDILILTRLRSGTLRDEKLPITQFTQIFKDTYGFAGKTTIWERSTLLRKAGITAENYADKLAAGEIPRYRDE